MKLFVAADHRGFDAKTAVVAHLQKLQHDVSDVGDQVLDPEDDFPVFAVKAANAVLEHPNSRAILICGSGQGMVMAANRLKGIRAGLGWSREAVRSIRNDEDSNVLAVPAELFVNNSSLAYDVINDFLNTPFANAPRFVRRNRQLDEIG